MSWTMSLPFILVRWLFLRHLWLYHSRMDQMSYGKCFTKHHILVNSVDDWKVRKCFCRWTFKLKTGLNLQHLSLYKTNPSTAFTVWNSFGVFIKYKYCASKDFRCFDCSGNNLLNHLQKTEDFDSYDFYLLWMITSQPYNANTCSAHVYTQYQHLIEQLIANNPSDYCNGETAVCGKLHWIIWHDLYWSVLYGFFFLWIFQWDTGKRIQ